MTCPGSPTGNAYIQSQRLLIVVMAMMTLCECIFVLFLILFLVLLFLARVKKKEGAFSIRRCQHKAVNLFWQTVLGIETDTGRAARLILVKIGYSPLYYIFYYVDQ